MRLTKKSIVTGLLLALMASLLLPPIAASAGGLGIAPSIIDIQNVLKGTERSAYITVMNLSSEDASFKLGADGDFRDWITFFDVTSSDKATLSIISVPAEENAQIGVTIKVPPDAANGEYFGFFSAETTSSEAIAGAQVVVVRMQAKVRIVVTGDEILTGSVAGIGLLDIESGQPLRINVIFQNTGNVIAQPFITYTISKDGASIAEFSNNTAKVGVGAGRETISTEWQTTGQPLGDYAADVSVKLGEKVIATQQLRFKILEEGSLTPQGELTGLRLSKQSATSAMVIAKFKNTGKMDVEAVLIAEIYRDGKLADTVQSEEALCKPDEEKELKALAEMEISGEYVIKGLVSYDGIKTEAKEVMITVLGAQNGSVVITGENVEQANQQANPTTEGASAGKGFNMLYPIIGGTGLVVLIIVVVWMKRRD